MTALRELAKAAGLDPDYTSWRGEPASASEESVFAVLRALAPDLGVRLDRAEDAAAALAALERQRWAEIVPPVVTGWDGALEVPFSVAADLDDAWEIEVTTESGRTVAARGRLFELPADSHAWPHGVVHCVRRARIDLDRELGYHTVRWRCAGNVGEAFGIAAPLRAFGAPGRSRRDWGVFAPVYGLASPETGQAGDLGTLKRLFELVERRGGHCVATLPILAAFLDEPCLFSPYSPASRMFWNELYIDLHALAADVGLAAPTAPPIVAGTRIDYRAQYHWRRQALDPMCERILATRGPEIDTWAQGAGAYDYAAFRAIGEATRTGWREWPAMWRDGAPVVETRADAIALGADGTRVGTHVAAQWVMQRQLAQLHGGSVGLYLDLPVGVSTDAYEVWRNRHLFLIDLAAGAPPDALFLGGQNWGLPPLSPVGLRRDRYRYFIRCVQHHVRVSSLLRIDHVMGLFRLYCVPTGRPATDGVYIRYPHQELLAILTLESSRAQCALVGEDLGTVPDQVRPAMGRHGMYRLHVGQWNMPPRTGAPPQPSPRDAVASLNTHDTATFAGWWRGADIDDQHDLGLIDDDQDHKLRVEREQTKAALLAFVRPDPRTDALTDVERAMVAATADLAAGPAELVLVALDDLALEPFPHNVPGTTSERPNWQRRVDGWADALDENRAAPAARAAIAAVVAARNPSR